jgi:hypothetical protein
MRLSLHPIIELNNLPLSFMWDCFGLWLTDLKVCLGTWSSIIFVSCKLSFQLWIVVCIAV